MTNEDMNTAFIRIFLSDLILEALDQGVPHVTLTLKQNIARDLALDLQQLHAIASLDTSTGEYSEDLHEFYR